VADKTVREQSEDLEDAFLSPYALRSRESRGRAHPIDPCDVRTEFQRDRDRILHSKAFRRLKGKTQVFLAPLGDHYRTRLTHTLEVSQIARTIARGLRLNEDLTEAIALSHDLGHTPFGHAGEGVLARYHPDGFRHDEQSLRVVDFLENEGTGLNLTYEPRDGISAHSKGKGPIAPSGAATRSCEGVVVRYADVIAYLNHDIEDALRAEVLDSKDLPAEPLCVLGSSRGERIGTMVTSVIIASQGRGTVTMSSDVLAASEALKGFMYERVYPAESLLAEVRKAMGILEALMEYYVANPADLPPFYADIAEAQGAHRAACDYVAGMTDRFALDLYTERFIPKVIGYS